MSLSASATASTTPSKSAGAPADLPATMRVISHPAQDGDATTLHMTERPRPSPQAGQLLVRVQAAGVNRADILQRQGRYPPPPGAPETLGLEVAGDVVALGEGVEGFAVGDAVFGLVAGGGYAEYAVLDSALTLSKPREWCWEQAASLPEVWMTAWFNLVEIGRLQAGQAVLLHAGASGVGSAAIQLARWLGARVFTTAGSAAKCRHCEALGAERAINYRETPDFPALIKGQGGVDLVLDCVGGDYLERNLACLKPDGMLIVIGAMGGRSAPLDMGRLLAKRLTVRGSTLRNQPLAVKARLAAALRDTLLPELAAGRLQFSLDRVFDGAEAAAAHRYLEDQLNCGKVVLRMTAEEST